MMVPIGQGPGWLLRWYGDRARGTASAVARLCPGQRARQQRAGIDPEPRETGKDHHLSGPGPDRRDWHMTGRRWQNRSWHSRATFPLLRQGPTARLQHLCGTRVIGDKIISHTGDLAARQADVIKQPIIKAFKHPDGAPLDIKAGRIPHPLLERGNAGCSSEQKWDARNKRIPSHWTA